MFLQLYQTPAFSPYVWFCYQYHGPLQCAFLILVYLHRFPESEDIVLARYCIEEIIDHTVSYYQVPRDSPGESRADDPECDEGSSEARIPLAIQVLVDLKSRVDSQMKFANRITDKLDENKCWLFPYTLELGSQSTEKDTVNESIFPLPNSSSSSSTIHNHRDQDAPSTATATQTPSGTRPGPTSNVFAAEYDSGLDQDVLASLTDFESWSSSLARPK